jgi:hypothetical protein
MESDRQAVGIQGPNRVAQHEGAKIGQGAEGGLTANAALHASGVPPWWNRPTCYPITSHIGLGGNFPLGAIPQVHISKTIVWFVTPPISMDSQ